MSRQPTTEANKGLRLSGRARRTQIAHIFKAVAFQHHKALIPILRPLLPEDGLVLDVGAHAGQMAKLFARLVPSGRIYAFEPGQYALSVLRPAVALRGRGRIEIVESALGAKPGTLTINTPVKRTGSYGFGLSHLGAAEARASVSHAVAVDTIDEFVRRRNLARVDFIKADIEGWEMQMLLGANETLARFRPALMLEVNDAHLARAGDTRAALWRFLTERNYRPCRVEVGTPPFGPEADGDIVWIPAERALG